MRITPHSHPKLWRCHERLTPAERAEGFEVDEAAFWRFRAEQNETHPHLSDEDKELNAVYNAHQHPGFKPAPQAPQLEVAPENIIEVPAAKSGHLLITIALWLIVLLLLLILGGVRLHAQSVFVRGVTLSSTPAANVTVTSACIANHNCLDVALLNIPHVICDSGCSGGGGGGGTSSTFGATFPATGTAIGVSDGTNMVALRLGQALAAASLPVILPSATITTLTPPTAAAIGTSVSTDLLIGTQLAGASVPVALPAATISTLTPPAAITNYALETGGNLGSIKTDVDKIPSQGQALAASSTPVVLTAIQTTTLTPPTAAAIGTATSADLLIGTQLAGASVPTALPTATITTLTPPTAAAIGTATSADLLIGTQLAAASVPVALPTATIATLTPPAAITNYALETSGNLGTIATNSALAATASNQTTGNSSLSTIATNTTGGSTAANQSTEIAALSSIVTNTGLPRNLVYNSAGTGNGNGPNAETSSYGALTACEYSPILPHLVFGQAAHTQCDPFSRAYVHVGQIDGIVFTAAQDASGIKQIFDPCQSRQKTYNATSTAAGGTVALNGMTGVTGSRYYICSWNDQAGGTALNYAIIEGTSTCSAGITAVGGLSGGTTAATGWNVSIGSGRTLGNGEAAIAATNTTGDGVCVILSGSTQVNFGYSYVIAP